jgi:hypothetical protein
MATILCLVIKKLDNCNPIVSGVYYEASDVMLLVSLLFQRAHFWPLEKP